MSYQAPSPLVQAPNSQVALADSKFDQTHNLRPENVAVIEVNFLINPRGSRSQSKKEKLKQ